MLIFQGDFLTNDVYISHKSITNKISEYITYNFLLFIFAYY